MNLDEKLSEHSRCDNWHNDLSLSRRGAQMLLEHRSQTPVVLSMSVRPESIVRRLDVECYIKHIKFVLALDWRCFNVTL